MLQHCSMNSLRNHVTVERPASLSVQARVLLQDVGQPRPLCCSKRRTLVRTVQPALTFQRLHQLHHLLPEVSQFDLFGMEKTFSCRISLMPSFKPKASTTLSFSKTMLSWKTVTPAVGSETNFRRSPKHETQCSVGPVCSFFGLQFLSWKTSGRSSFGILASDIFFNALPGVWSLAKALACERFSRSKSLSPEQKPTVSTWSWPSLLEKHHCLLQLKQLEHRAIKVFTPLSDEAVRVLWRMPCCWNHFCPARLNDSLGSNACLQMTSHDFRWRPFTGLAGPSSDESLSEGTTAWPAICGLHSNIKPQDHAPMNPQWN